MTNGHPNEMCLTAAKCQLGLVAFPFRARLAALNCTFLLNRNECQFYAFESKTSFYQLAKEFIEKLQSSASRKFAPNRYSIINHNLMGTVDCDMELFFL